MKKIIIAIVTSILVLMFTAPNFRKSTQTVPEKIIETILIVGQSSGVVVYSDAERSLILTARHNILNILNTVECPACLDEINIHYIDTDQEINEFVTFKAIDFYEDENTDLALIEIKSNYMFKYAEIIERDLRLGEDIYLASHPDNLYRSLKKGIIGSTFRVIRGVPVTEISGGVIYGSSGGGVFNMDGELSGIILTLRIYRTDYCYDLYDENDKIMGEECIDIPMTFLGFAAQPNVIKSFLLNSKFNKYFKYLME